MTSATDELRRMLDERGVEWWEGWDKDLTCYDGANGVRYIADVTLGEMFFRSMLPVTPAQAVEATLGRGTCKLPETRVDHGSIEYNGVTEWRRCSVCGEEVLACPANFCPNCGREVVE